MCRKMMHPNISMSEKKIKLEDLTWTGNSENGI